MITVLADRGGPASGPAVLAPAPVVTDQGVSHDYSKAYSIAAADRNAELTLREVLHLVREPPGQTAVQADPVVGRSCHNGSQAWRSRLSKHIASEAYEQTP